MLNLLRKSYTRTSISSLSNQTQRQLIHYKKATHQASVKIDKIKGNDFGLGWSNNPIDSTKLKEKEPVSQTNLLDSHFSVIPSDTWRNTTPFCQKEGKENNSKPKAIQLRTMEDSWLDILLNFKDDPGMVKKYEGAYGEIQVGKIMEDLDKLAAGVAYKYCGEEVTASNLTIVTASVDRIELLGHIDPDKNYRLGGYVTYVGYSSLEVFIQMNELNSDGTAASPPITLSSETQNSLMKEPIMIAKFTMVTLNKYTKKPSQIHPLLLQGNKEKTLFNEGLKSKLRKMTSAQQSLDKKPPSAEERLIIHDLYLESLKHSENNIIPENARWMDSTQLQSVLICQPQDRNVHQFIFGGFLMRLAYNLSWATGYSFLKTPPKFVASDEIQFQKPVPIGSILTLTSKVCYAPGTLSSSKEDTDCFQVAVQAHTLAPGLKEPGLTNTFRFKFCTPNPDQFPVPQLRARSYAEFIEFLEGRRRSSPTKSKSNFSSL